MDRTAELIKIDNMLHELEIKLAQNKSSQDLQRVLQIKDPTTLKEELSNNLLKLEIIYTCLGKDS
jgi:hypothetical protein